MVITEAHTIVKLPAPLEKGTVSLEEALKQRESIRVVALP